MQRNMPHALEILVAAKRIKMNFIEAGIGTPADHEFIEAVDTVCEFVIDVSRLMLEGKNYANNN